MERLLVNFFDAHPVGHAIEALHYAHGHHAAGIWSIEGVHRAYMG